MDLIIIICLIINQRERLRFRQQSIRFEIDRRGMNIETERLVRANLELEEKILRGLTFLFEILKLDLIGITLL